MKLLSDFDGVWTDPSSEADMMGRIMIEEFVRCGPLSEKTVRTVIGSVHRRLLADPAKYGWISNGRISAYVDEDPFIIHTTTSIYLESGAQGGDVGILGKVILDEGGIASFTSGCYVKAIERYRNELGNSSLENDAGEFVSDLEAGGFETIVVSNSPVSKLNEWLNGHLHRIKVRGDAGKFNLDGEDGGLRVDDETPAIFVDRPSYRKILLEEQPGIVIGDGLSQDMALPNYLRGKELSGNLVLLFVKRPHTPAWAVERFRNWSGPSDAVVDGFGGVRRAIKSLAGKI